MWIKTELYFGRTFTDDNGAPRVVSNSMWNDFSKSVLNHYLSEGFTVLDGQGCWTSPSTGRQVVEKCKVLVLVHQGQKESAISAVTQAYKARFNQESVLRVDTTAAVNFI